MNVKKRSKYKRISSDSGAGVLQHQDTGQSIKGLKSCGDFGSPRSQRGQVSTRLPSLYR